MDDGRLRIIDNINGKKLMAVSPASIGPSDKLKRMLSNGNVTCITKDSNPDGISGPALLVYNYGMKPENTILTNYKDLDRMLARLNRAKISDSVIVFNDMGISPGNLDNSMKILKLLKSRKNRIIWIDHHPWDKEVVGSVRNLIDFAVFGENPRYCATELVFLLLCKDDKTGRKIAMLAHYADFAIKSKYDALLKKLSYAIMQSGYDLRTKDKKIYKIIKAVSELDFNNRLVTKLYSAYIKDEAKNMVSLLKNSRKIKTGKYSVGLAFGERLQTNAACAAMKRALHTDINIYVNIKTGKSGIRGRNGLDSSLIAKRLGGGGHPQASGFSINPSKLKNSNKSEMERFAKKIGRISEALYG